MLLGRAAVVVNTVQQIGQAAGVAVVTVVFDAHGSLATPSETLSGYEPALVTAACIAVLGALAALGITRPRRTPSGFSGSSASGARIRAPEADDPEKPDGVRRGRVMPRAARAPSTAMHAAVTRAGS